MTAPVSVVIPYFEGGDTIGRALRSIREQTLRPAEIVIVDDGSRQPFSREGYQAGEEVGVALEVVRHPENQGIPAARNTGARHARHDWIAFLDQDDEWLPEKLERQWRLLDATGESTDRVVYSRCRFEGAGDPRRGMVIPPRRSVRRLRRGGESAIRELMVRGNVIPFIGLLVHRSVLERHGMLREDLSGGADDYELVLRLAAAGVDFRCSDPTDSPGAIHHHTGANYSDPLRWLPDEQRFIEELGQRYPAVRTYRDRALSRLHFRAGLVQHRRRQFREARDHFRRATALDPLRLKPWLGRARSALAAGTRRLSGGAEP